MMAKRTPPPGSEPEPSLPHERHREARQPYTKETEDYGQGVANPPEEQEGGDGGPRTPKATKGK